MAERIDEVELKALIAAEIRSAVLYVDTEISATRTTALEYIRGVMTDTPSLEGRSSVVSRDVADTISWIVPGIIRVFSASDRMAEYEPEKPNDEEGAKQATDYVNYVFWKDNPGYRVLWDSTQDALSLGNGVIKHYWDDSEECEYSEHSGLTTEQIALLQQEQGVEITAQKQGEPQRVVDPQTGQPVELETYDIKIKRVTSTGRLVVECIEPENFLMDATARTIEEARFTAHRDEVSRSKLIEMGFDRDLVDELPVYQNTRLQQEEQARTSTVITADIGDDSTRLIELFECYVRCDVDGDGISETVRAYYAGSGGAGELLDWEVWDDDVPFSDIPCEPVAHRWDARSITDKTMDVQRINTVLTRQLFDNIYGVGLPQREAEEGSIINPEMLTAPKFGGIIWRKKGSQPVIPHVIPFIADKILLGIQHMGQVLEKRTGVSRASMALDPETLQNQTAEANRNQKDASYSQIELIARNMAELGWRRVFKQMLRLIVKHQDRPRTIRLRDEWVEMDPRHWNANMDVTVNTGLGTGSRDRDMSMLNNTLQLQIGLLERYTATGLMEQALDMLQRVMKTAQKLAESSGLKNPDEYFPTISAEDMQKMAQTIQQKASQPDPKIQAQMQIEQGKAQVQMQLSQAELQQQGQLKAAELQMSAQAEAQKSQAAVTREAAQLQADLQTKEADRQNQLVIEDKKQQLEFARLAEESRQKELDRQLQRELEMAKISAQREAQQHQMAVDSANKQADREHSTGIETMKAKSKPKAGATK